MRPGVLSVFSSPGVGRGYGLGKQGYLIAIFLYRRTFFRQEAEAEKTADLKVCLFHICSLSAVPAFPEKDRQIFPVCNHSISCADKYIFI